MYVQNYFSNLGLNLYVYFFPPNTEQENKRENHQCKIKNQEVKWLESN